MIFSLRHWTPRYIVDKLRLVLEQKRNPSDPWLTVDSIKIIEEFLKPSDVAVEFGSGRSTAWFAERVGFLTSIESNRAWFEKVSSLLTSSGVNFKVDYKFVSEESAYSDVATSLQDNSIDFCLVDGIERDQCALKIIPKIKPGGMLVVDNINWFLPSSKHHSPSSRRPSDGPASQGWQEFSEATKNWRSIWTSNGVTDTYILIKNQ